MRLVEELKQERDTHVDHSLYWWTQVMFAYNSSQIEGSLLNLWQTEQLYETGSVFADPDKPVRQDDLVETTNHFHAFNWVLDHVDEPVSGAMACKLHAMLKWGTGFARQHPDEAGHYKRHANVIMGGLATNPARTALPSEVPYLMEDVYDELNTLIDDPVRIAGAHWMFERVHPFLDGNGRVGRLLLFKQCLHLDIMPPLIQDGEGDIYYRALSQFPNDHGYLADCILHARDTYQSILDQLHPTGLNISYNDGEDAEETDTSRYTAFENQIDSSRKRYESPSR